MKSKNAAFIAIATLGRIAMRPARDRSLFDGGSILQGVFVTVWDGDCCKMLQYVENHCLC